MVGRVPPGPDSSPCVLCLIIEQSTYLLSVLQGTDYDWDMVVLMFEGMVGNMDNLGTYHPSYWYLYTTHVVPAYMAVVITAGERDMVGV